MAMPVVELIRPFDGAGFNKPCHRAQLLGLYYSEGVLTPHIAISNCIKSHKTANEWR